MEDFDLILDEIQKIGDFDTVASLADKINVSAAQLSRIKSRKSPLSDETIDKICNFFKNDVVYEEQLRVRLKKIQSSPLNIKSHVSQGDALEEFHNNFFYTQRGEKRIICITYRDLPQSREKGKNPEYIQRSADVIINSDLVCGLFQCFGPIDLITENLTKAAHRNDIEARDTWSYIQTLALGVHEIFNALKEKIGNIGGKIVLYEAIEVPELVKCDIHSRLMYSEKLSPLTDDEKIHGRGKIRIVQLIIGKDENNVEREFYIECNTDPTFQSAVSTQFYPVLHYWRDTKGNLPVSPIELKSFVAKLPGGHTYIPWKIYI